MDVDGEIKHLIAAVQRLGKPDAEGKHVVTFGVLFDDDECANLFEAIVGTLKAAKKRGIVAYQGEMLLKGMSDNVEIKLLKTEL